jgi:hypothetical protein
MMDDMSAFGSKADVCVAKPHVRFTPNSDRKSRHAANGHVRFASESGHVQCTSSCLLRANSGHSRSYSITSSARVSNVGGTVRCSAFAVLRLMTSSNLVGCCTGRLAGFSLLRSRPVYLPTRRSASLRLVP